MESSPVKLKLIVAPTELVSWNVPLSHGEFVSSNEELEGSGVDQTDWSAYDRTLSKSSTVTLTLTAEGSIW